MGFGPVVSCGGELSQIVGRGPVPRHAQENRTLFMTHDREGQALALR